MRILLFGVSCVGKSTIGKLLAEKWNYRFIDFDFEVEARMGDSIERIKNTCFNEYEYRNRVKHILVELLAENRNNVIIAMEPSGLFREYKFTIDKHPDILTITLKDKAKNIVNRLAFYDEDTVLIEDYVVDDSNYDYYYKEVKADIEYYHATLKKAKLIFNINGMNPEDATDKLADTINDYISTGGTNKMPDKTAKPSDKDSKNPDKSKAKEKDQRNHIISDAFYKRYDVFAMHERWDGIKAADDGAISVITRGDAKDDEYSGFAIFDNVLDDMVWDYATWEECFNKMVELDKG